MIRSSNEISRETCQIQNVDGESTIAARNSCTQVPGPEMSVAISDRERNCNTRNTGRSGWQESEPS
jgi:hypothetical protein